MEAQWPISKETFLRDYWQKKPLKMSKFIGVDHLLSRDDIAGCMLEDSLSTRLILPQGEGVSPEVVHGPLTEECLSSLQGQFCLMVTGLNEVVAEVSDLRKPFDFLPSWRFDDVMVSYGTDGSGVGPHLDRYDVFLIQAQGRKEWRFTREPTPHAETLPEGDLCILKDPSYLSEVFVMEPGDCLYIPPGVGHQGTCIGEAVTYSVGFRATPLAQICESVMAEELYCDPDVSYRKDPLEIQEEDLLRFKKMMIDQISQMPLNDFGNLVGKAVTGPGFDFEECESDFNRSRILDLLERGQIMHAALSLRAAHWQEKNLYIEGDRFHFPEPKEIDLVRQILKGPLSYDQLVAVDEDASIWELFIWGLDRGWFVIEPQEPI